MSPTGYTSRQPLPERHSPSQRLRPYRAVESHRLLLSGSRGPGQLSVRMVG